MLPFRCCVPRALGSAVSGLRPAAPSQQLRQLLQPAPRLFARPFGLLSVRAGSARRTSLLGQRGPCACGCGCGALHTEGDKAFVEFLSDEIKEEKKIQKHKSLPKVSGGWELEVKGTEAKLVRKVAGEKITVTFNINNSIPPTFDGEEPSQGQKVEEQEPELTSTPNFVVEVTKSDGKKALVLDCHYPEDEVGQEEEEENDIFSIREVSFQSTDESDWNDTKYTLNTDSLDWALYDHLMDFLADRGVDNTFADELVELSTALEHQEYIAFLEDLKSFVKSQ
ncbi:complement component 1 Q subcomponent-binding protein, mitochondrial [Orycteropus afer afer]|uniref:Complement component 1 Q subcomponent-binding protein, mitochondrial n=1 Tax=Orycteropus afer afer TaxID=1230840 RepID=A0A8B6ZJ45_ORYAF|nr:complement component 1 Q subcomponent-binding protein, mitochondrial [Orycteropus afer afer]